MPVPSFFMALPVSVTMARTGTRAGVFMAPSGVSAARAPSVPLRGSIPSALLAFDTFGECIWIFGFVVIGLGSRGRWVDPRGHRRRVHRSL